MRKKIKVILTLFIFFFLFFNNNLLAAATINCDDDSNCSPYGKFCVDQGGGAAAICVDRLSDGQSCDRNEMCQSLNCDNNFCMKSSDANSSKGIGKCPVGFLEMHFGLPFSGMQKGDCVPLDTGAGDLIQYLVKFILGSIGTISVIILIVAGFKIAFAAGNATVIKQSKEMIRNAFIGIITAIFSGSVLSLINPDLIGGNIFNVKPPNNIEVLAKADVAKILNKNSKDLPDGINDTKMLSIINEVSIEKNVDYCILYTFASKESNGIPYAIGHDEKVYNTGSWRSFCSTKTYYTGNFFDLSNINNCNSGKNVSNNDNVDYNDKNNLGLDWRYSHGIGMMQITIFPNSKYTFEGPGEKKPTSPYSIKIRGNTYYAKDLLDPKTSLIASIDLLYTKGFDLVGRTNITDKELLTMFERYNGAGDMAKKYANEAYNIYEKCKRSRNR